MRKIILGLFIILFCFSIGIAELQEEDLSKEERAKLEKQLERITKLEEKYLRIFSLYEEIKRLEKEIADIQKQLRQKDVYELMKESSKAEEKDHFSWREKYRMYPSTSYWLDSLKEPNERYLERIEEENDRLEDLLDEIRSERFNLEMDMIYYRNDMLMLKPNPLDYYMATELGISLAMMDIELGLYRYYPSYSKKTDRTNYEPFLFTLCTDSKGKMDWTKYGWLKLLLKKK